MELVYLWVEDYKNIQKQGFNFSPKYNCDYDEANNELTIDENDDYIENFFGDNINVTAIVGKNGSGKSSVLELLFNYKNLKFIQEKNLFILYEKNDQIYCMYSLQCRPEANVKNIKYSRHEDFLERFKDKDYNWHIGTYEVASTKSISGHINYKRLDGSVHSNGGQETDSYYLSDNQFFIHKYIDIYINNKQIIKQLKQIPKFNILRIKLKYRNVQIIDGYHHDSINTKNILEKTKQIMSKFSEEQALAKTRFPHSPEYFINYKRILAPSLFITIINYFITSSPINSEEFYSSLSKKLDLLDAAINNSTVDFKVHLEIYEFIDNIEDMTRNFYDDVALYESIVFLINLSEVRQDNDIFYYDFDLNTVDISTISLINKLTTMFSDNDEHLEQESLRILELDLINNQTQTKYKTISDGEKQFLKVTIDFFTKLPYVGKMTNNKSHIFFSDEMDESLHPSWKKNLISHLLDILKIYTNDNENIFLHLIFTTHSPFLLSDIPKQNIIFLDKDADGKCKVVDGLNDKKQTFGANIHTLLSDSFFMEDGLMGEFAKNKIRTIKVAHQYILHKHKRKTLVTKSCKRCRRLLIKRLSKFWQIQKIIGEPFLQKIVKNQLEEIELILLGRNEAIDKEIVRLQALKESSNA